MPALWASGGVALALLAGLAVWLAPLNPDALALQLAFTPREFGAIVHSWSPEQLARYRAHLPVDFVLLAAYGAFGWLLGRRTSLFARLAPLPRRAAAWALPVAAAFDAVENTLHWWLTAAPRFGLAPLYATAASAATAKWALVLAFGVVVAHALVAGEQGADRR